jgi:hypothetical protein
MRIAVGINDKSRVAQVPCKTRKRAVISGDLAGNIAAVPRQIIGGSF